MTNGGDRLSQQSLERLTRTGAEPGTGMEESTGKAVRDQMGISGRWQKRPVEGKLQSSVDGTCSEFLHQPNVYGYAPVKDIQI